MLQHAWSALHWHFWQLWSRKGKPQNKSERQEDITRQSYRSHCDPQWLHLICTISICHLPLKREWNRSGETERLSRDACTCERCPDKGSKTMFLLSLSKWHVYGEALAHHSTSITFRERVKGIEFPQFHAPRLFPSLTLFLPDIQVTLLWAVKLPVPTWCTSHPRENKREMKTFPNWVPYGDMTDFIA